MSQAQADSVWDMFRRQLERYLMAWAVHGNPLTPPLKEACAHSTPASVWVMAFFRCAKCLSVSQLCCKLCCYRRMHISQHMHGNHNHTKILGPSLVLSAYKAIAIQHQSPYLGWTQTHGTLLSRQSALPLSYQGSSAGLKVCNTRRRQNPKLCAIMHADVFVGLSWFIGTINIIVR